MLYLKDQIKTIFPKPLIILTKSRYGDEKLAVIRTRKKTSFMLF